MSFSSRLRQAREQANLTQQDFAKKLGVTKNAISNYENGVSSPKWDVLVKIFDVLQVEPNFLYQDDFAIKDDSSPLTSTQVSLLSRYDKLNEEGKTKVAEYIEDLILSGRYSEKEERTRQYKALFKGISAPENVHVAILPDNFSAEIKTKK